MDEDYRHYEMKKRRTYKNCPALTQEYIDRAIMQYIEEGGTIKRLDNKIDEYNNKKVANVDQETSDFLANTATEINGQVYF